MKKGRNDQVSCHHFVISDLQRVLTGYVIVIDNALIQQVGLSEEQFTKFTELELATFSIMIHCRRSVHIHLLTCPGVLIPSSSCKQSFFVDKTELTRTRIITCPLPGCNNVWCKACYQKVTGPASQHSCDGSSELKHLMKQKGWKHCPGKNTNISHVLPIR